MNNVIKLLQNKAFICPPELLFNYRKLKITEQEVILLIYLINNDQECFNPKEISHYLSWEIAVILETVNNLSDKGIVKIDIKKKVNIREEYVNLDGLYNKLAFIVIDTTPDSLDATIYERFEKEFGRTLSPIEYELINSWIANTTEEMIVLALKEAVYNGVSNLRYIDKIIHEWGKNGIKSIKDVNKQKTNCAKNNSNKNFDYDWLNEETKNN